MLISWCIYICTDIDLEQDHQAAWSHDKKETSSRLGVKQIEWKLVKKYVVATKTETAVNCGFFRVFGNVLDVF